jgi:hypothetical protein
MSAPSLSGKLDGGGGVEYYSNAVIPYRQDFASRVQVSRFFSCSLQDDAAVVERIVRVESIRCIEGDEILVRVLVLDPTDSHTPRGLPTFTLGSSHDVHLNCILQPVHVYPACSLASSCTIHPERRMPHEFAVPCTALNGDHMHTDLFIHNIYLVK